MLPVCVICLFVSLFLFSPFLFFLVLILVIFHVYPFALTHLSFPPTSIQPKDMCPMHTTLATFSNYFPLPSFSLSLPPYLSHSLFLTPSIPPSHPPSYMYVHVHVSNTNLLLLQLLLKALHQLQEKVISELSLTQFSSLV